MAQPMGALQSECFLQVSIAGANDEITLLQTFIQQRGIDGTGFEKDTLLLGPGPYGEEGLLNQFVPTGVKQL